MPLPHPAWWLALFSLLGGESSAQRGAKARPVEVDAWIAEHAAPLRTTEAGHGFDDLAPIGTMIGDAHVVALGEATHGTREFFQLKHRLLEYLVAEKGFTVFGIEASMPEAFDVNEYVLHGRGDPERAVAGLYFRIWNTEEVLDMIRWMRAWNADPAHRRKVKFYGYDLQYPVRAVKRALAYMRSQGSPDAAGFAHDLAPLASAFELVLHRLAPLPTREATRVAANRLVAAFDSHRNEWSRRTGVESYAMARQYAHLVAQFAQLNALGLHAGFLRDGMMAENIGWILRHEDPGTRMVVWAHNGHVQAGPFRMGQYLRSALGNDLVICGFAFDRGAFRAVPSSLRALPAPLGGGQGLHEFTAPALGGDSLGSALASAGYPLLALDLRQVPTSGPVAWLREPRRAYSIGAVWAPENPEALVVQDRAPDLYDVLLFAAETHAARANPQGGSVDVLPLLQPANGDFESPAAGSPPAAWYASADAWLGGYEIDAAHTGCHHGSGCGRVARASASPYGEVFGSLSQPIAPERYQGRTIRVRLYARATPGSDARVWLQAFALQPELASDVSESMVSEAAWREYSLQITVPEHAMALSLGLALEGPGSAWIDDVRVEDLSPAAHDTPHQGDVLRQSARWADRLAASWASRPFPTCARFSRSCAAITTSRSWTCRSIAISRRPRSIVA